MDSATLEERREAYAEKIESKRERYADRADKARRDSSAAHDQARSIGNMIPFGQPILVGHHSEKKHRGAIAKIDRSMRKSIDLSAKADHYENKAANYGNSGAIMSDNPDAIDLLRAKLSGLELERDNYKVANKLIAAANRTAKKANGGQAVEGAEAWIAIISSIDFSSLGNADEWKRAIIGGFSHYCQSGIRYQLVKFGYTITNLGANIRTVRNRIAAMEIEEQRAEEPAEEITGDGFTVEECPDDNRIRFFFDGKPEAEIRTTMKRNGFRWSPRAGAWQRQLNANGRSAARRVAEILGSTD